MELVFLAVVAGTSGTSEASVMWTELYHFKNLFLNSFLTTSFSSSPTNFRSAVTTWEEMGVYGAHLHHLASLVAQLPTYDYCYLQGS